jgi:trehalose 6-phosphate phosphatase
LTHAILVNSHLSVLTGFAMSNVLVALDYDGTLAPIAETPERAAMRDETRSLLIEVARLYPCIVISGRSLDDVASRLEGIPLWYVFGNHGIEPAADASRHAGSVRNWVRRLADALPDDLGVTIEDKRHSITLHYRHAPDKHRARSAIEVAVGTLPQARVIGGIEAVSVLPVDGRDKGGALQQARRQFACDTAIYVGDDDTDETAFASDSGGRLLAIKVGASQSSTARYHLEAQQDIDRLLQVLIEARFLRGRSERGRTRFG